MSIPSIIIFSLLGLCLCINNHPEIYFFPSANDFAAAEESFTRKFGWAFTRYDDTHWYWEGVIIAQKCIISAVAQFNSSVGNAVQGALLSLALQSLFLGIHYRQRPFSSAAEPHENTWSPNDALTLWTDATGLLFIVFGLFMKAAAGSGAEAFFTVLFVILFICFFRYIWRFGYRTYVAKIKDDLDNSDLVIPAAQRKVMEALVRRGQGPGLEEYVLNRVKEAAAARGVCGKRVKELKEKTEEGKEANETGKGTELVIRNPVLTVEMNPLASKYSI